MIILVGNTKGGVGKSTVAIQFAVAMAAMGRNVWVIDGDPQRTTATALQIRADSGALPFIAVSALSDGTELRTQVGGMRSRFDDIVIDAGGKDSSAMRAALGVADAVLVPFRPRSFDVWALGDMEKLVKAAREVRDGLRAYAFLNMADPKGRDNEDAAQAVSEHPQFQLLTTGAGEGGAAKVIALASRKAFSESSGKGMPVMDSKDPKATAEMRQLFDAVFMA